MGREHAVVIGRSIAGLLVARVLADHFQKVTVVERDGAQRAADVRRGVPQGHHGHLLLKSGERILEHLFPGIVDDLVAGGAVVGDFSADVRWWHEGAFKYRYPSGFLVPSMTRPYLEWHVRRRLAASPNVVFRDETTVGDVLMNEACTSVVGVHARPAPGAGIEEDVPADLVIDAGGRGSKAAGWLERFGFLRPPESTLTLDLSYTSCLFQRRESRARDWKAAAIYPRRPQERRGVFLYPVEGDRWIVSLQSYGDHPPTTVEALRSYVAELPRPFVADTLADSLPLTEVATYHFPRQVRRHFTRLRRIPEGYLTIGDALCSFDPVFGQGMTVAGQEAMELDRQLRATAVSAGNSQLVGLPRRFYQAVEAIVDVPWLLATVEAFRYPETQGPKPPGLAFFHWYNRRVYQLTTADRAVYDDFVRVLHLLAPPTILFRPRTFWKVMSFRHRASR